VLRTEKLGEATAPDGTVLSLFRHGRDYFLRVGVIELMSTRRHQSEERFSVVCCEPFRNTPGATALIGGLGLGFSLRKALEILPADARVVVAELVPEVVEWNRNPEYGLACDVIDDPRVEIVVADVVDLMKEPGAYDSIMLDVDNGADSLTTAGNKVLYGRQGVQLARAALRPRGLIGYWLADDDPTFVGRLQRAGFTVEQERVRAHNTTGPKHTLIIAKG
jgi:spermidine synthase